MDPWSPNGGSPLTDPLGSGAGGVATPRVHAVAVILGDLPGEGIDIIVIVAVLGHAVQDQLAQGLVTAVVRLERGDEIAPRHRLLLVDEAPDRRQAIGGVGHLGQDGAP